MTENADRDARDPALLVGEAEGQKVAEPADEGASEKAARPERSPEESPPAAETAPTPKPAPDDDDDEDFGHLARIAADPEPAQKADDRPVSAEEPEIPLSKIDPDALWVVRRLRAKGFEAYLTGGCVRDLLLGRRPKDFDVATAAHPDEVRSVFRNCRLIGRRFRLAHVYFPSGKVIETATFRANPLDLLEDMPDDLLVERDNVFGTVEEDARRRDLTINGLFYDPLAGKVLDFVDGRRDLEARLIRTIGDPHIRFQEDPVRILRAIKFAARLGFTIEDATWEAMKAHAEGLIKCAPARLLEEMHRLLVSGHARQAFELCFEVGVIDVLMPELKQALEEELLPLFAEGREAEEEPALEPPAMLRPKVRKARLWRLLSSLDEVRRREVDITSGVAFTTLLLPVYEAFRAAGRDGLSWVEDTAQVWTERIRLTRDDQETVRYLLRGLEQLAPKMRRGAQARHLVGRPWFREALLLYTISLYAEDLPLDEVGLWKGVAKHYQQPYKQPRVGERAPRPRRSRRSRRLDGGRRRGR